jgi:DNA-binding transcriptional MerR regulator
MATNVVSAVGSAPAAPVEGRRAGKSAAAFRTISEVANELEIPQHVLRFWESKFSQVKPLKRGGGRRYYRPEDVDLLRNIQTLLYRDGYTIKGVQKLLREGQVGRIRKAANGAVDGGAVSDPAPKKAAINGSGLDDSQRLEIRAAIDELTALKVLLKG